jgi:steroid delta-isomerase-like uncharacterized protein
MESKEKNKETAKKVYKALETGNTEGLENYIDENMVEHSPDPFMKGSGLEYVKNIFAEYRRMFPDLKIKINQMIAEGDNLAVFLTLSGTNKGEFMGKPATGHQINIDGFDLITFKNGKAAEHWGVWDTYAMMTQLGFIHEAEMVEHHKR